jgi:hypothetical protein
MLKYDFENINLVKSRDGGMWRSVGAPAYTKF